MPKFNKAAILAALDERIASERKEEENPMLQYDAVFSEYEKQFNEWKGRALTDFTEYFESVKLGDSGWNFPAWKFSPPHPPRREDYERRSENRTISFTLAEQAKKRIELMQPDKNGVIILREKDPIFTRKLIMN